MVDGEDEHKDAILGQELEGMPVNSGACLLDLNFIALVSMLIFLFDTIYYSTSISNSMQWAVPPWNSSIHLSLRETLEQGQRPKPRVKQTSSDNDDAKLRFMNKVSPVYMLLLWQCYLGMFQSQVLRSHGCRSL
jgi:hypothetical protein